MCDPMICWANPDVCDPMVWMGMHALIPCPLERKQCTYLCPLRTHACARAHAHTCQPGWEVTWNPPSCPASADTGAGTTHTERRALAEDGARCWALTSV